MRNHDLKKMSRHKNRHWRTGIGLTAALVSSQMMNAYPAFAEEWTYEGVTSITSTDYYLDLSDEKVALEIEEVYVSAGDRVEAGDAILKFTDESYQEASAYYAAAIIKAEGSLTDGQLSYDQGVLSATSEYEVTQADAENAEFIRAYRENEVARALKEHEEILTAIDERIQELEEGIEDGSYEASAGGGGVAVNGGGNVTGSPGNAPSNTQNKPETKPEAQPETKPETETEKQTETETEKQSETLPGDQPELQPGTEPGDQPETQPGTETENQPAQDADIDVLLEQISTKESEVEAAATALSSSLENLTGTVEGNGETDNGTDYQTYRTALDNLVSELTTDISLQDSAAAQLEQEGNAAAESIRNASAGNSRVLSTLNDVKEKIGKYDVLISLMLGVLDSNVSTALLSSEVITDMSGFLTGESELRGLYVQLLALYTSENTALSGQVKDLQAQIDELKASSPGEQPGGNQGEDQPGGQPGENQNGSQPGGQPGENQNGSQPGGQSGENQNGSQPGGQSGNQNGAQPSDNQNAGQTGTQPSAAGGGMPGGGGMPSGGGASGAPQTTADLGSMTNTMGMGMTLDTASSDISILGSSYDLTEVQTLLEREPSSSDNAQELIDELEDKKEDVQLQFEELVREEPIYQLQIQYQYETAILAARLEEITYQQELSELLEELEEYKQSKGALEKGLQKLENYQGNVVTAPVGGTISDISYEAGDTMSLSAPLMSIYDTDYVYIQLVIPQEEIDRITVGDTAQVTIGGMSGLQGCVVEKSVEPESGTSRTTVQYQALVRVDNSDGRLSAGSSAVVSFIMDDSSK